MRLLVVEDLPTDVKSLTGMLELYALTALPPGLAVRFALLDVKGKSVQEKIASLAPGADTLRTDAQFAVDPIQPASLPVLSTRSLKRYAGSHLHGWAVAGAPTPAKSCGHMRRKHSFPSGGNRRAPRPRDRHKAGPHQGY